VPYVLQRSKSKLKDNEANDIPEDNPDSNKYNRTKKQGQ
jgi:hypothetical protein